MQAIPRTLVARALFVPEDGLPEGDLPITRFAEQYADFLAFYGERKDDDPDVWLYDVMEQLIQDMPTLALAAIRATLAVCETPGQVANLAAGPLETLLAEHGPTVIGPLAEEADARMLYALTGVWRNSIPSMVWARIESLRREVPGIDDEAPLPPA